MLRLIKILFCSWLLALAAPASAFSLLGPLDGRFQTTALGYDIAAFGGPMNIGEEYRWTVPDITYAFDESFLNYFGARGMAEVDAALKVFSDLPNAEDIKTNTVPGDPNLYINGNAVPISSTANNFSAGALGLLDVKSYTMAVVIQYLGLAFAENWVWCLRDRTIALNSTATNYFVIKRNFDPITWEPTNAVNTAVYTYTIVDGANGSDAVESLSSDPFSTGGFSTVAGGFTPPGRLIGLPGNLGTGQYYTGLTRDDVGGLRYLLLSDNKNLEALRAGYTNTPLGNPWSPGGGSVTNGTNQAVINALRGGVQHVSFRRVEFDSLVGLGGLNFYTNTFTDHYVSNGVTYSQSVRLRASVPDIIIGATDLGDVLGPLNVILGSATTATSPGVNTTTFFINSTLNGLLYRLSGFTAAGPGTIGSDLTTPAGAGSILFNKVGPALINSNPSFLTEVTAFPTYTWGTFNGSSDPPVAYPNGASIQEIEQRVFTQP